MDIYNKEINELKISNEMLNIKLQENIDLSKSN